MGLSLLSPVSVATTYIILYIIPVLPLKIPATLCSVSSRDSNLTENFLGRNDVKGTQ